MSEIEARDEVTQLLRRLGAGADSSAAEKLLPLVYTELRRIAARCMNDERANHTLQPTALVHEAFLRLVDQHDASYESQTHFLCIAAQAMRRILVDNARAKRTEKRGEHWERVTLNEAIRAGGDGATVDLIALDDALGQLTKLSGRQARVVELRFFAGLSVAEAANALGVSVSTVEAEWRVARAWLAAKLSA